MNLVQLGKIAQINPKSVPPSVVTSEELFDFLPMADVSEEGRVVVRTQKPYSAVKKGFTPFARGDLLVAKITPCFENNKIASADIGTELGFGSTEFHVVRCDPRALDARYVLHLLRSDKVRAEGKRRMTGSAGQQRVPAKFLEELEIPLPPLPEQNRIAAILDQADELRRKRQRAIDRLNQLGQAIFYEMFVKSPDVGDWPKIRLSELADIQVGFAFKSSDYRENGELIRLCRGANVLPDRIDWSDLACLPAEIGQRHRDFLLCEGDTVIAMDRPWISSGFKIARVGSADQPALLVQRVARLRAAHPADREYLHFVARSTEFQSACKTTETTVPHISPTDIRAFTFRCPPKELRRQFAVMVSEQRAAEALAIEGERRSNDLFCSLQHRAFRGEL